MYIGVKLYILFGWRLLQSSAERILTTSICIMKVIFAVFLLCVPAVAVERTDVTPVQKVVQLMQGMLAKGQKEKHNEQVQFAAYKQEPNSILC